MNARQAFQVNVIVSKLREVRANCTHLLRDDKLHLYICTLTGRRLSESAEHVANFIIKGILEVWPNEFPFQYELATLLKPLREIWNILSLENLKSLVCFTNETLSEADERISLEEFKQGLLVNF